MPIRDINEIANPVVSILTPVEENQDVFIPDIIDPNIPNRNGFISIFTGSGGSGKSSLLLNMVTNKNMYRNKFDNIFYICLESSFCSAVDHPFKDHDKVFHELNIDLLQEIYDSLKGIVLEREEAKEALKKAKADKVKKKNKKDIVTIFIDDLDYKEQLEKIPKVKYNLIIIDDFADALKHNDIQKLLSSMLIKARHINTSFIFTLQAYTYFPKILRKQITNAIIFKTKNVEEFISLSSELCNMNKHDALTLFNYCFDGQPYNHLDIDTWKNTYMKNFNLLSFNYDNEKLISKVN